MKPTEKHPEYSVERIAEWQIMRDTAEGETKIKAVGERYLPIPAGWRNQVNVATMYKDYIVRARFPEFVSASIRGLAGVLHGSSWQIKLPSQMEYLLESATKDKLPLEAFARRVSMELLTTGRYAVLADVSQDGGDPYLCGYAAESVINWDENFYVLSETVQVRTGFKWEPVVQTRVLRMDDRGSYVQDIYLDDTLQVSDLTVTARGGVRLQEIPFVVGGAIDMRLTPECPPLLGVARAAVAGYQINADYRLGLYMSCQDTLVFFNVDPKTAPKVWGSGVSIAIQSSDITKDVRAEFVSPDGTSIEAHERAMDREAEAAIKAGAQLFDNTKRSNESGAARRLRFAAETASLQSIANSSAALLEKSLKNIAIMLGANSDDVQVTPPQNMLEGRMEPQESAENRANYESGLISFTTAYERLQQGLYANPDRSLDDEIALIEGQLPNNDNVV